jgi:hypothetical protein
MKISDRGFVRYEPIEDANFDYADHQISLQLVESSADPLDKIHVYLRIPWRHLSDTMTNYVGKDKVAIACDLDQDSAKLLIEQLQDWLKKFG